MMDETTSHRNLSILIDVLVCGNLAPAARTLRLKPRIRSPHPRACKNALDNALTAPARFHSSTLRRHRRASLSSVHHPSHWQSSALSGTTDGEWKAASELGSSLTPQPVLLAEPGSQALRQGDRYCTHPAAMACRFTPVHAIMLSPIKATVGTLLFISGKGEGDHNVSSLA